MVSEEIARIRAGGVTSLRGIAEALNDQGISTATGGHWHPMTVARVLTRIEV